MNRLLQMVPRWKEDWPDLALRLNILSLLRREVLLWKKTVLLVWRLHREDLVSILQWKTLVLIDGISGSASEFRHANSLALLVEGGAG